jgi:hypothetical protein
MEGCPENPYSGGVMIRPAVWVLLLPLVLGGCAVTYTHPTKSSYDLERDRKECELAARKQLAAQGVT